MTKIDKLGEQIKQQVKARDDAHQKSVTYLERRKAATEAMRPLVAEVRAAFERGETVNGQAKWMDWCHWANPTAKNPARWFQIVLAFKKETKERREVTSPLDGIVVAIDQIETDETYGTAYVALEKETLGAGYGG